MIFPYIMTYCHQIYLQFYTIFSSTIQSVIFLVSFSSLQMFLLFHCFFETSALILHRFSHFFLLLFDILLSGKYVLFLFQILILYIFLSVSIFHNDVFINVILIRSYSLLVSFTTFSTSNSSPTG